MVTLKNGTRLEGVAKNHSNYSLQLLDDNGKLHLLNTQEIQDIDFRKKSLMPDNYGERLSPEELTNVLAFLSRQAIMPASSRERSRVAGNTLDAFFTFTAVACLGAAGASDVPATFSRARRRTG